MEAEIKNCSVCKTGKPLSEYYIRKESGKPHNRCKRCCIEQKNIVRSETHKVCKHCGEEKPFSDFQKAGGGQWLQPYCKPCDSARKKVHYEANRKVPPRRRLTEEEKKKEAIIRAKAYAEKNRNKILEQHKQYYVNNKERFQKYSKEKRSDPEYAKRKSEMDKAYRINNAEKIKANKAAYQESGRATEIAKAWQLKQKDNIEHVTKKRLRGRIYVALKRGVKSESTMALLGCSIEFFKQYFESLFTEGMSWERYMAGDIVIDHVKPCKLFDLTKPEEQKACFHYKNLQPLWEIDNLKKGITYHE